MFSVGSVLSAVILDPIALGLAATLPPKPPLATPGIIGYNVYALVRRGLIICALCALFGAPHAAAGSDVERPPVTWSPAGSGANFTPVVKRKITTIVIHATEGGSLIGNVSWLASDESEASAHYVVSRFGTIIQLVPLHDIAWHSGNRIVNDHSVGVEHVGETYDPAGFTAAEYQSSARLVAWLVRRYDIPIDRKHIIGHAQVPDPFHPGLFGGSSHHTDPGPHWKWGYYLRLVRKYAFPVRLQVTSTTIDPGAALQGIVPWRVATRGVNASRVDFLVDGRVKWSDSVRPFAFAGGRGLNTTSLPNGTHVLTARATGSGANAAQRLVVHVVNHAFAITTSAIHPWQKLKGVVKIRANAWGATANGVGLYVDGRIVSRDRTKPYSLRWDTRRVRDGRHDIALIAVSNDRRAAKRSLTIVVSNKAKAKASSKPKPTPKPSAPPKITAVNVADGQTVSGVVDWRVRTIGPVARVELRIDGTIVARPTREPWSYTWDTAAAVAGSHTLEATAYTTDGQKAVKSVTVTVAQPAAP
jgi:N-acetylmuramoyl-L-alanine amidase/Bacterial Ig domain